ncbi:hypothetical protein [Butyrivibrio sp. MC2021]|uniref:hypothetical protein n=1 Tax=Butyrivibrio sp. MC2021 TaxID=1408306 RepID=UPI00055BE0FA|nr:hypothetical protein [Butyrivibrio sp. MC2021]
MKNKGFLLFKTLLLSTSSGNIYRTTTDKKKKGKIIGSWIGMSVLYLLLIFYCVITAIGYSYYGLGDSIPAMTAVMISGLSFIMTMLKAGSYLFGFREYEMLMSLPFSEKEIVSAKFMYMYMKTLPWNLSISLAMMVGYGIILSPAWYTYVLWTVLSFVLPVIPMLVSSFIGFGIARIGTTFKHWKAVQTVLTFGFVMLAFMSRFIIESIFRNNQVEDVLVSASEGTANIGKIYFPVAWFVSAVTGGSILGTILLIVTTAVLFELVFTVFAKSYKKINSAMKTTATEHKVKKASIRKRSAVQAIALKELRKFVGSTPYFVNVGFGYIFALIVGVLALIVGLDRIIATVVQGAPVTIEMVLPALPFVIYFLTGMVPMTTCSPSLEGKNYWIIKSSPVRDWDIYMGKLLASLYVAVPAQLIGTLFLCISAGATMLQTISFLALGLVLSIFSSSFGLACGIHFMKLDWENEIEVIKQGTAVVIYLFPNMILTFLVMFGGIFLSNVLGVVLTTLIAMLIYCIFIMIAFLRVKMLIKAV